MLETAFTVSEFGRRTKSVSSAGFEFVRTKVVFTLGKFFSPSLSFPAQSFRLFDLCSILGQRTSPAGVSLFEFVLFSSVPSSFDGFTVAHRSVSNRLNYPILLGLFSIVVLGLLLTLQCLPSLALLPEKSLHSCGAHLN